MESPSPDDGFDFELVDVCPDDEYEFVELPAAHAQPVAFPSPGRETIRGCDDTKTIVQSPPPHGAVAPIRSSSPPPKEEETVVRWQFNLVQVGDEAEPKAAPSARDVTAAVAADLPPLWYPSAHGQAYGEAGQYDEDEDEDEYDGMYESCYDFADFGRSRNVKRSSGRRGRTKKKTSMGRPRGEERSSHIAGKW